MGGAVTAKPAATLREVRRGDDLHELQLVGSDGIVVILHGYGLTVDEQIRTRETALRLIRNALEGPR
jgi:hypothetical protein